MFMFGGNADGMTYQEYKDTEPERNGVFCAELIGRFYDHVGAWPKDRAPVMLLPANLDGKPPEKQHPIPGAIFDEPFVMGGTGTLGPLERVVEPTRPDLQEPHSTVFV